MQRFFVVSLALCGLTLPIVEARAADVANAPEKWSASWITPPDGKSAEGAYLFRKFLSLDKAPKRFVVHVSADNRYRLYVNGRPVSRGPARGDLSHWRYDTVDLAHHLKAGRNILAAVVWNYGSDRGLAQISAQTGFMLQGHSSKERIADSNGSWVVARNDAHRTIPFGPNNMGTYYVAGPGDSLDGRNHPWGWQTPGFDDSHWSQAEVRTAALPRGHINVPRPWALVPNELPPMEERLERLSIVRASQGIKPPSGFPGKRRRFVVPPKTRAIILLDHGHLTTAYPQLFVSGGKDSKLTVGYAESLYLKKSRQGKRDKGNRNDIEGKTFSGNFDQFICDGGKNRLFEPLWWRTYRYLRLTIQTAQEPLVINDLRGVYTGYPFTRNAHINSIRFGPKAKSSPAWLDSRFISKVVDVGWRTARLCAHETYMDCPYYEQLQYAGDTRIQALVSLYMSGDDRLMKKAIAAFNDSRIGNSPPFARYPSRVEQYIPPFALWWIAMVHDHFWYRDDPAFIRSQLPGVRSVLSFFENHARTDGRLGALPWWNFVDWNPEWTGGVPPGWNKTPQWVTPEPGHVLDQRDPNGGSAVIDLQWLLALQQAAEMESAVGVKGLATNYNQAAGALKRAVRKHYWVASRGLFADTAAKDRFSQHANALAVLAGVSEGDEASRIMHAILASGGSDASGALADDPRADGPRANRVAGISQATTYFNHYVHAALIKAGLGAGYLEQLGPWQGMLKQGLTTWAETHLSPPRSDCHAWGASPNIHIFRSVLGVDSASPGFKQVQIKPHLGHIEEISGTVPHPRGEISVSLMRRKGGLRAQIRLPQNVEGTFLWRDESRKLQPGINRLRFPK